VFSIEIDMWENFTKIVEITSKKKKITSIFYWFFGEVCRWKSGRRVTTLFHWRCEWLSLQVFYLKIFFSL